MLQTNSAVHTEIDFEWIYYDFMSAGLELESLLRFGGFLL